MRVVHLNTHDVEGGAARLALRLALGQRRAGDEACLLVGRKSLAGDLSARFDPGPDPVLRPFCEAARLDALHFQGSHDLDRHPLVRAADLVHVHNIHFDYCNPFSLSFLSHARPTVWTWHDLWPATGLCIHPGPCPDWERGCRGCPRRRRNEPWSGTPPRDLPERQGPGPALALAWKRLLYGRCHLRVALPSQWMRRQAARSPLAGGLDMVVVPNGIDTAVFAPSDRLAARRRLGLPEDAPILGAVAVQGVLDNPLKGGRELLAVLDLLAEDFPDLLLLNIGAEGPAPHPRLRNIPFIREPDALAQAYAAMDLFVHAAKAESFCLVAAEAMACGLAVAAGGVGALPEVIEDGVTGLLCPPGAPEELAQACRQLLGDPARRAAMGRAGRERAVARLDFARTEAGYRRLYEDVIAARRETRPPVLAFDLASLPALLKTPDFLRAEGRKLGRDLSAEPVPDDPAAALLGQLTAADREALAPFYRKAALTRRVFALRAEGRLSEALAILEELLGDWPDDLALWRTKGVTQGLMGEDAAALASLEHCLAGDPPQTDVWLNMADIHLRRGDLAACARALDTFAGIDSRLRGFNHRLGLLRLAQGRPRQAVRAFLAELRLHGAPESVAPLRRAWRERHRSGPAAA